MLYFNFIKGGSLSSYLNSISWPDVVFVAIVIITVFNGFRAGVGVQILSLLLWIACAYAAIGYYPFVASKISGLGMDEWAKAISFFAICAASVLILRMVNLILKTENAPALAPIERLGGVVIASLRACLLVGIIGIQLLLIPIDTVRSVVREESKTGMFFVRFDTSVYYWINERLGLDGSNINSKVAQDLFIIKRNPAISE